jgi:hypothetical protein
MIPLLDFPKEENPVALCRGTSKEGVEDKGIWAGNACYRWILIIFFISGLILGLALCRPYASKWDKTCGEIIWLPLDKYS